MDTEINTNNLRTVFLVNPVSNTGHLDSYCKLYTRIFLELEWNVVLISPTDSECLDYLKNNNIPNNRFLFVNPLDAIDKRKLDHYEKIKLWRNNYKSKINAYHKKIIFLLSSVYYKAFKFIRKSIIDRNNSWFYFKIFKNTIDILISKKSIKPDLIFIMYLDGLGNSPSNFTELKSLNSIPWSGILFSPKLKKKSKYAENYFSLPNSKGAIFLVEKYISIYKDSYPSLDFYLAPDVTDISLPDNYDNLERIKSIQDFSRNRKIVSLLGTLTPHKGVIDFINLSKVADSNHYCFVMIGKLYLDEFSEQDQTTISNALNKKEMFIQTDYIQDESEYNSIYKISDIIYAVYNNFDSSSNTLTKSANFHVPILADAHSTVGDRVTKFKLGETVTQNNIDSILLGLEKINTSSQDRYDFTLYKKEHSLDKLKSVLEKATSEWLN